MPPLVSVICLCYNHERFVRDALQSVIDQTYSPIELIVVDDFSRDRSAEIIRNFVAHHPEVTFIQLPANMGNCRAFNRGLAITQGKYIIDLAADDVLTQKRVERGVAVFESNPEIGVQFSDAELMDENGLTTGFHSDKFPHITIPSGMIFSDILSRYFINSPTMMMRKSLLDELGGYDESLAYEDFDFWVRSTQRTQYKYLPDPLVKRRVLTSSMGRQQYDTGGIQQQSTFVICKKALALCKEREDFIALKKRIRYEFRRAVGVGAWGLSWRYLKLWSAVP